MKQIALSEIKDDFSRFLREAASEQIVITRHGRPAGVLVGFASEDDWFDYRLENDSGFLVRIASARASIRAGRGVRLEDLDGALQEAKVSELALRETCPSLKPTASTPKKPSRPPRSGRSSRAGR